MTSGSTVPQLDRPSQDWFSALCTGLLAADVTKARQAVGDLVTRRTAAGGVFTAAARGFAALDTRLTALGAPAVPDGQRLQGILAVALPAMAGAAARGATAIAGATDAGGLDRSIDQAAAALTTAQAPLTDLSEALAEPDLAAQLVALPACRNFFT